MAGERVVRVVFKGDASSAVAASKSAEAAAGRVLTANERAANAAAKAYDRAADAQVKAAERAASAASRAAAKAGADDDRLLMNLEAGVRRHEKAQERMADKMIAEHRRAAAAAEKEAAKVEAAQERAAKKAAAAWENFSTRALQVGAVAGAAIVGGSVKAAIDYEQAFANVRKTVDATEPQLKKLNAQFREMSKEIPKSAADLANLGAIAGQFGIATEDIASFTRTIANLSVAVDGISGEEAAAQLAQIGVQTKATTPEIERMASVLVALGNVGNSTEGAILEMASRIAGAGTQAGLSKAEIFAFAAAVANTGIEAEKGGSAISKTFRDIATAIAAGGDDLKNYEKIAGQSLAGKSTLEATQLFITGLSNIKGGLGEMTVALEEVGIKETRQIDTLVRLAGNTENLSKHLVIASAEYERNRAAIEEAEKKYETTASQLTILKNTIVDVGISIGNEFLPKINEIAKGLGNAAQAVLPFKDAIFALGGIIASVFVATKIAAWSVAFSGAMTGAIAALTGPAGVLAAVLAVGVALNALFGYFEKIDARAMKGIVDGAKQTTDELRKLGEVSNALGVSVVDLQKRFGTYDNLVKEVGERTGQFTFVIGEAERESSELADTIDLLNRKSKQKAVVDALVAKNLAVVDVEQKKVKGSTESAAGAAAKSAAATDAAAISYENLARSLKIPALQKPPPVFDHVPKLPGGTPIGPIEGPVSTAEWTEQEERISKLTKTAKEFGEEMVHSFVRSVQEGRSFGEILAGLNRTMASFASRKVESAVSGILGKAGGLLGSLAGPLGGLAGSLAGGLVGKVGGFLGGLFGGKKKKEAVQNIEDVKAKYEELLAKVREGTEQAVGGLGKLFTAFRVDGAESMARLGVISENVFKAMTALPGGARKAIESLGPGLDAIVEKAKAAGLALPDGIAGLVGKRDFIAANKDLFDSLEGLTDIVQGLAKANAFTAEGFVAIQQQASATIAQLVAAGSSVPDALSAAQPILQALVNENRQYGTAIDAATQGYIDQAAALGLVKVQGNDAFALADRQTNKLLIGMAEIFGKQVPSVVNQAAQAGISSAQSLSTAWGGAAQSASDSWSGTASAIATSHATITTSMATAAGAVSATVATAAAATTVAVQGVAESAGGAISRLFQRLKAERFDLGDLENIPKFDVGTPYVPRDMLAVVHKGERIVPAEENRALMSRERGGGTSVVPSGGGRVSMEGATMVLVNSDGRPLGEFIVQTVRRGLDERTIDTGAREI